LSSRGDEPPGRVAVGDLGFDPGSGELTGPAGVRRIPPQPASLLALLAVRQGEVVTRDHIRQRLWPGGKVEFEQGIAFAVREVRKAIESVGGDPAMIETVPKRGFRLITTTSSPEPTRRLRLRRSTPAGDVSPSSRSPCSSSSPSSGWDSH